MLLFHGVAHIDQGLHLRFFGFGAGMGQHLAELGVAAATVDLLHQRRQRGRFRHPARRPALVRAAEIEELDVEPADRLGFQEHVRLQPAGGVPGRLPAHGGVERKDQPATAPGRRTRARTRGPWREKRRSRRARWPWPARRHDRPAPGCAPPGTSPSGDLCCWPDGSTFKSASHLRWPSARGFAQWAVRPSSGGLQPLRRDRSDRTTHDRWQSQRG